MRQTYLVFLTILIIIVALLLANLRINLTGNSSNNIKEGIILENLPMSYCPKEAEIYQDDGIGQINIIAVTNCHIISIVRLNLSGSVSLTVKLPKALAFTINYSEGIDLYYIGLRVGDVTGDNIIDKQDEDLVVSNLFNTNSQADADMDGEITVYDLSLTRINKAVGVSRPDSKGWEL